MKTSLSKLSLNSNKYSCNWSRFENSVTEKPETVATNAKIDAPGEGSEEKPKTAEEVSDQKPSTPLDSTEEKSETKGADLKTAALSESSENKPTIEEALDSKPSTESKKDQ